MSEISSTVPLYAGMTYAALAQNVMMPRPPFAQGNPSDGPTMIAMGELENVSSGRQWLSAAESDAGRRFELFWNAPRISGEGGLLLAVARSLCDRGILVSRTNILQPRVPAPFVELNSHDAEQLGIAEGARVRLSFDSRVIELKARVDGHVPPDAVLVPNNLEGTAALPMGAHVKVEKV
jgi:predicted molibdopterin-dependent oxidoreductase YjgC